LTKLDISKNSIGAYGNKEGWIALAAALKANTGIRELNIAENILGNFGPENVVIISDAIKDMGALTSLNLADNSIGERHDGELSKWVATPGGKLFGQLYLSCA
jgi:Ran GTPase-activating protein (RanGAP) involved in mRNA processing and transport